MELWIVVTHLGWSEGPGETILILWRVLEQREHWRVNVCQVGRETQVFEQRARLRQVGLTEACRTCMG